MTPISANTQFANDLAEIKAAVAYLGEMKASQDMLHKSLLVFREEYVREHAIVLAMSQRAHTRIDDLQKDYDRLTCDVHEMMKMLPLIKAIAFILMGISIPLLLAIFSYIWSLITHGGLVLP